LKRPGQLAWACMCLRPRGAQLHGAPRECIRYTNCFGMGARAAAGLPSLDMRRLLEYVCDIAVAVPSLARVLAHSVLPLLALLARPPDRSGAPRSNGQPILVKVL